MSISSVPIVFKHGLAAIGYNAAIDETDELCPARQLRIVVGFGDCIANLPVTPPNHTRLAAPAIDWIATTRWQKAVGGRVWISWKVADGLAHTLV